jgi:hypothetical protein
MMIIITSPQTGRLGTDCYSFPEACDGVTQCKNEQDEEMCNASDIYSTRVPRLAPPAIVHFDGYGVQVETR